MNSGGTQVQPSSDRPSMTMRERVARAIDPAPFQPHGYSTTDPILSSVLKRRREAAIQNADAALTALEDPTPEMVEAGRRAINEKWGDFDALSDEEMIRVVWPAMIRAAKQEK